KLEGYLWQGKQYEGLVVNVLEGLWAAGTSLLDERDRVFPDPARAEEVLRGLRQLLVTGASPAWVTAAGGESPRAPLGHGGGVVPAPPGGRLPPAAAPPPPISSSAPAPPCGAGWAWPRCPARIPAGPPRGRRAAPISPSRGRPGIPPRPSLSRASSRARRRS